MNYQIRLARQQDQDELLALMQAHGQFENSEVAGLMPADPLMEISALPVTIFVVEDEHRLQGYMSIVKQFSTWDRQWYLYLDCLYLTPQCRGRGIGQHLMHIVQDEAKQQGISLVQWQTPSNNRAAIAFYQKLGAESKTKQRFFWLVKDCN